MNDIYQLLMAHISSVWRRRWYVIALAWLICGAGWTMVAGMPDRYASSARIYVDMDTMLGPLMKGIAVEVNLYQQIDIMKRTLLSRPNLEKIILMTDLDLTIKKEEDKESLINQLRARIFVDQQGRNLFRISYEDTDKTLTKRVVQAVMQIFVEGNLGASRKDMDTTRRFLEDQIRDYERQLGAAEQRLAKFKRKNMGRLPGSTNYYDHMQIMRQQLAVAQGAVSEAITVRDELRVQLKDVPQFLEVTGDTAAWSLAGGAGPESDLQLRIIELEQVIDSLLTRYTEKHPDVISTQRRLDALKKELEDEVTAMTAMMENAGSETETGTEVPGPPKSLVPNPVYEQVKLQLIQQEGTIAALKNRIEQTKKEVEKWSGMAQLVPEVEAQLVRLNRDYDIIKNGYQQLRQRQESAKLARDLETKAQKVQFRIIDPPTVPLKPIGPNRPLFHGMVLIFGILGGIGFSFLLSQINATFSTVRALRSIFTLPVLGRISAVVSMRERRRRWRELFSFGVVFAALVAAYVGLVSIEVWGTEDIVSMVKEFIVL